MIIYKNIIYQNICIESIQNTIIEYDRSQLFSRHLVMIHKERYQGIRVSTMRVSARKGSLESKVGNLADHTRVSGPIRQLKR